MRIGYGISQRFCQLGFLSYFRGRVFGREHVPRRGPVVLVCNHQSFMDPVFATQALPRECHYMARDTLFKNAAFRRVIEYYNAFPVRRGTADIGAIKETLRRLKRGGLVTMFPEGTRTPDGRVGEMQSGVVLIARKARAPLVPTMILGAFEAWPRHRKTPRFAPVIVAYGQPVSACEVRALDAERCIEILRERIIALMQRYRSHSLVAHCGLSANRRRG